MKKDIGMLDEVIELLKNLTSMEAHSQSSYKTTGDERWLKAKDDIRKIRQQWLDLITKKDFGQVWCYSKHSCEAMMRLDEIQARFLSNSKKNNAKSCAEQYKIILSWLLELNDIDGEIKSSA